MDHHASFSYGVSCFWREIFCMSRTWILKCGLNHTIHGSVLAKAMVMYLYCRYLGHIYSIYIYILGWCVLLIFMSSCAIINPLIETTSPIVTTTPVVTAYICTHWQIQCSKLFKSHLWLPPSRSGTVRTTSESVWPKGRRRRKKGEKIIRTIKALEVSKIRRPITFQHHNTSWIWFMDITIKCFGNSHTNFGVLSSMHAWVKLFQTWGRGRGVVVLVTLMLHETFTNICL